MQTAAVAASAFDTYQRVHAALAGRRVPLTARGRCGAQQAGTAAVSRRPRTPGGSAVIGGTSLVGQADTPRREIERDLS